MSSPSEDVLQTALVAARTLSTDPEIALIDLSRPDPVTQVSADRSEYVLMGMLHLGIERYRDIKLDEAVAALEEGVDFALASFLDLTRPELVADFYLYLGLCRLETGEPDLAHIALKNMFGHAPAKRFRAGWFPSREEKALRAAALDFVKSPVRENPMDSTGRILSYLKDRDAQALVYLYINNGQDGVPRLETRVFEVSARDATSVEVTRDSRPFNGGESASLAVSAWLACTDLPSRVDNARRLPRVFLDTSFSYGMFLSDKTTRTGFHNTGLSIGLAYQIQPGLDTFIRLSFYRALEDSYGDLLDDFWSLKAAIGVGYSAVFSWGRVFTHFGFDMDYLSGFKSSTDPRCKLWPDDPDLCPASQVNAPSFLFGATGMVGVNVFVSRSVFVNIQAGVSGYFVSNGPLIDLNFPFVAEIGFGYAFF